MSDNKKIDRAIKYYQEQEQEILKIINQTYPSSPYQVIEAGRKLLDISAKISALGIAKNN